MNEIKPSAVNGDWQLFLLGHSKENERKALIKNIKTNEVLDAKVTISGNQYIIVEAVDRKLNSFVDFAKTFSTKTR